MGKFIDLTGKKLGKLLVKRRCANKGKNIIWECLCECGKISYPSSTYLLHEMKGKDPSCGCNKDEKTKIRMSTHGMSGLPEYKIWKAMKKRCSNNKSIDYHHYGGRGIKVCDRWRNSFESFLEDMGNRPSPNHSIDRLDVNGDYCKDNCKWAEMTEQARNRRIPRNNTSGHKGVQWREAYRKWSASIGVNGARVHLGYFDSIEKAIDARRTAELTHWGKSS